MDSKFRSVLNLALHPSTGEGEAQAALNRARVMVAKTGFDSLVGAAPSPIVKDKIVYRDKEKVVYKDKLVYRDRPSWTTKISMSVKVRARWQFSMIERMLVDAPIAGVEVFLQSCESQTGTIDSGVVIKVLVCGTKLSVEKYDNMITDYIDQTNKRDREIGRSTAANSMTINPVSKKKTFARVFIGSMIGFLVGVLFF